MSDSVAAVVVTHNRKDLLVNCIRALLKQTQVPEQIFIVDNASCDGTQELLRERGFLDCARVRYVALTDNTGGAGGFHAGIARARELGYDWFWLMDDDAVPDIDSLEMLMLHAADPFCIYGSAAIDGNYLAWPVSLVQEAGCVVTEWDALPEKAETQMQPFLGFCVNRALVEAIGLPDPGYFIAADDLEYCVRAKAAGARIFVIKGSRIQHPRSIGRYVTFLGHAVRVLSLPPWKRYYDTRNRLLIGRKHHGFRFFVETVPGSLLRLVDGVARGPNRGAQLWAVIAGFIDGFLGRKGKLHDWWRVPR